MSGNVHTNTIEGFFGNIKRGISGNYHAVSRKWLQGYLNEFCWRYNQRRNGDGHAMFAALALKTVDTALRGMLERILRQSGVRVETERRNDLHGGSRRS